MVLFWREWGYVTRNDQLPYIYGGRNNNVLDHFWCNFSCEYQNGGNNGGSIMMHNYGLDHRDLGEHFLVLKYFPLMCEDKSSSYARLTSQDQGRNGDNSGENGGNHGGVGVS